MLKACSRIIEYSFYCLFLLTPLAFTSKTSELFELNKMWLTWALTIIIVTSWLIKMILQKKFLFQRTPLDIPIGLFLISQIISTIFSLDIHTSIWGYYSRFNGGLLSIISYILLYYAFLSNFPVIGSQFSVFGSKSIGSSVNQSDELKTGKPKSDNRQLKTDNYNFGLDAARMTKRLLLLSLISGAIVALWGLPSRFGYDPTCLLFRGTLDVSCWTADFLPKVRIFSTLGQPAWLAAYLAILMPISIAFFMNNLKSNSSGPQIKNHESPLRQSFEGQAGIMNHALSKRFIHNSFFIILTSLFYVDILFTNTRSGFLGIVFSLIFFACLYYWIYKPQISISRKKLKSPLAVLLFSFLILTFIIGAPIGQLNKFSFREIGNLFQKTQTPKATSKQPASAPTAPAQSPETNITESGDIRLLVWEGALNAWKANPVFGTGVETFAFAYYKYKPTTHNLTSEWNFLYNKAHNEYLNFLATTGIVGLGSYLFMIGTFFFLAIRKISKSEFLISNQIPNSKSQLGQLEIRSIRNLILALLAAYLSILITNFFGFSVVITNIYLFMIPAFVFVLTGILPKNESAIKSHESSNLYQWTAIFFILVACYLLLAALLRYWQADTAFALGYNLDRAGEYQQAYPNLHKAVALRGNEPVFKDELSINDAVVAAGLISQKSEDASTQEKTISLASSLAQEAINTSNEVISKYSNNVVFWKTRTRLFFTLSQVDSRYLPRALDAIEKASVLAPNDANIWYNLGVLYGQNNNIKKGISAMEKTVRLKSDYRDAYYALGLFYHTDGQNEKATAQMQYILDNFSANDSGALESLKDWDK